MDRFFLPTSHWADSPALTDDEAHHCLRVMRKSIDDEIEVFDGVGSVSKARILSLDRKKVRLSLEAQKESPEPSPLIELAVGIPKGKTMELIIQKAVELGVNRIVPLLTAQGNVQLSSRDAGKKAEKWQRHALEACKQCGQNWLPDVATPQSLESWLAEEKSKGLNLVAALLPDSRLLKDLYREQQDRPERIRFLVGPEGDLSANEYTSARQSGFLPIDLGDLVLRVETAAMLLIGSARVEFS